MELESASEQNVAYELERQETHDDRGRCGFWLAMTATRSKQQELAARVSVKRRSQQVRICRSAWPTRDVVSVTRRARVHRTGRGQVM